MIFVEKVLDDQTKPVFIVLGAVNDTRVYGLISSVYLQPSSCFLGESPEFFTASGWILLHEDEFDYIQTRLKEVDP